MQVDLIKRLLTLFWHGYYPSSADFQAPPDCTSSPLV